MEATTKAECPHVTDKMAAPRSQTCEGCQSDFSLRVCTVCGHVGCCESQLAHNTAHFKASGHPIIKSLPLSAESSTWCYECGRYL